ncbi:MAG: co-chaperone DjlA [Gammaproteobacteria bacterium]|nr:co-chaperone DjlA [Gammaproteobacteria bacterium]MDD9894165.1 co-chaperone DjlA [Gammaproteobacteria bacterium]MDD9960245.1 co-chaperone DjlA [Gammaproteobacteria bacterium]
MSWWGKVVGGTFGFMMGGPLGALLGAALGNYFDGGLDGIILDESLGLGATERVQSVFFTTTFALMGYIAKSDGRVTKDEIVMAEQVMRQMHLNPQQRTVAINLFNEGKKPHFPVHEVLAQFKRESFRRRNLVQIFLEIVVATAFADGRLDSREQHVLEEIAGDLGYTQNQFNELLARMTGQAHFAEQISSEEKLTAAYELIGVSESATDGEVKKAYRRQMNQHHPDKLVAKGLPEEMIDIATQKTQDIKAAYELIKSHRK